MKTIDIERLKDNLLTLAEVGKDEGGGVTRLAYSEEYYRGIELVKQWMEEASLSVTVDPVANVLGTRKGKTDRVMLIGSHTDTVEHGGIFDGCLGVLGAIEALRVIDREGIETEHTIVVANWAEEEGNVIKGLIGSGSFVGKMDDSIPYIEEKLSAYGIYPEDIKNARYQDLDKVEKYLELHIEQGGVLEKGRIPAAENESQKALELMLARFNGVLENAFEELAPHKVCAYIYELANSFNKFYHETKILGEENEEKRAGLVALLQLTKRVLETCIDVLGFEAPDRM